MQLHQSMYSKSIGGGGEKNKLKELRYHRCNEKIKDNLLLGHDVLSIPGRKNNEWYGFFVFFNAPVPTTQYPSIATPHTIHAWNFYISNIHILIHFIIYLVGKPVANIDVAKIFSLVFLQETLKTEEEIVLSFILNVLLFIYHIILGLPSIPRCDNLFILY